MRAHVLAFFLLLFLLVFFFAIAKWPIVLVVVLGVMAMFVLYCVVYDVACEILGKGQ